MTIRGSQGHDATRRRHHRQRRAAAARPIVVDASARGLVFTTLGISGFVTRDDVRL
jgi:hypothetical protein